MRSLKPLLAAALGGIFLTAGPLLAADTGTVLITGSNRGIGLEFVRQYAARGWTVIATARNPAGADELNALAKANARIRVEALDVADDASIAAMAARQQGKPIDIVINNAGILGDVPAQTIGKLDKLVFDEVMHANTFGALKVSEALKANLLASQHKKVFAMSSGLGSSQLTERRGGFYSYRMSKAALNIGFRALAADWREAGIMVGIIAPGMVETELLRESGFTGRGISTEASVVGLLKVIDTMTLDSNGKVLNYDGQPIPW